MSNGKIPAILDPDGPDGKPMALFESGAILVYLAGKTGRFLPSDERGRFEALQWLMFQMAGSDHVRPGAPLPAGGAEPVPYAIERYSKETQRLYSVLDKQLGARDFLAGEYSIADIATYPWVARHEWHKVDLAEFPNVKRWFEVIGARPAVVSGMKVPFLN